MQRINYCFVILVLVLSGCQYLPWGKDDAKPIFVGEPETIIVEPPEDALDVTYLWSILDLPDESLLVPDFSSSSNVFTFTADVPGGFAFAVIVESYGEEVADYELKFTAMEDTSLVPRQPPSEVASAAAAANALAKTGTLPVAATPVPVAKKATTVAAKKPAARATKPRTTRKAAPKPKVRRDKDVVPGHYTIQVSSWKTAKQAHAIRQQLADLGYDAYIQRIWLEDRQEVWWRVRMGDFEDVQEAKKARNEIAVKTEFSSAWVDNVRKENFEENQ